MYPVTTMEYWNDGFSTPAYSRGKNVLRHVRATIVKIAFFGQTDQIDHDLDHLDPNMQL